MTPVAGQVRSTLKSTERSSLARRLTNKLSEIGELIALERFGSVQKVRQIEIRNVVSDHDVRVDLGYEIPPSLQHFPFIVVFQNLRSDDMSACVEGKDVPDERLAFSLPCDHVGDLDDGIDVRFWEDTLSTGTLDIETEDSKGCNIRSITFR